MESRVRRQHGLIEEGSSMSLSQSPFGGLLHGVVELFVMGSHQLCRNQKCQIIEATRPLRRSGRKG